jgi:hypothetical protein
MGSAINLVGFECGNLDEVEFVGGQSGLVQSTIKRTGNYAWKVNASGDYLRLRTYDVAGGPVSRTHVNMYTRFYMYISSVDGDVSIHRTQAATVQKLDLRLDSSRKLNLYNTNGTFVAAGTTTLELNRWYRIEAHSPDGTTTGTIKLDGSNEIVASSSFNTSDNVFSYIGPFGHTSGTFELYFDDIIVNSGDFPGPGRIVRLNPTGVYTSVDQWTLGAGSTKEGSVSETIRDDDDTYISTSTFTNTQAFEFQDLSSISYTGVPTDVKSVCAVRRPGAASVAVFTPIVYSGPDGTTQDTTVSSFTVGQLWSIRQRVWWADPADLADWTVDRVNKIKIGAQHNTAATRELRWTHTFLSVNLASSDSTSTNHTISSSIVGTANVFDIFNAANNSSRSNMLGKANLAGNIIRNRYGLSNMLGIATLNGSANVQAGGEAFLGESNMLGISTVRILGNARYTTSSNINGISVFNMRASANRVGGTNMTGRAYTTSSSNRSSSMNASILGKAILFDSANILTYPRISMVGSAFLSGRVGRIAIARTNSFGEAFLGADASIGTANLAYIDMLAKALMNIRVNRMASTSSSFVGQSTSMASARASFGGDIDMVCIADMGLSANVSSSVLAYLNSIGTATTSIIGYRDAKGVIYIIGDGNLTINTELITEVFSIIDFTRYISTTNERILYIKNDNNFTLYRTNR